MIFRGVFSGFSFFRALIWTHSKKKATYIWSKCKNVVNQEKKVGKWKIQQIADRGYMYLIGIGVFLWALTNLINIILWVGFVYKIFIRFNHSCFTNCHISRLSPWVSPIYSIKIFFFHHKSYFSLNFVN